MEREEDYIKKEISKRNFKDVELKAEDNDGYPMIAKFSTDGTYLRVGDRKHYVMITDDGQLYLIRNWKSMGRVGDVYKEKDMWIAKGFYQNRNNRVFEGEAINKNKNKAIASVIDKIQIYEI